MLLALLCLLASACGARLSTQDRRNAIAALTGARGSSSSATAGSFSGTGAEGSAGEATNTSAGTAAGAGGTTAAKAGTAAVPGLAAAPPAGGNGGATDKGVTATEIRIANLSDVSGPSPGLFKTAQQGISALVQYVNSQGGIYGRKLKLDLIDSKTDSGANHAGALDACDKDFALVGSMSAFDDGGAEPIDKCKIPDLSAIPVNASRQLAQYTFGAFPNRPDYVATGAANYIKEKYGDSTIKKAGIFWINGAVTRSQAQRVVETYESVGYKFVSKQETQVVETSYCPYVLDMKNQGVDYVTSVSDFQSIGRFVQDIKKCGGGWNPKVKDWNSVVYSPGFISFTGPDAEGNLAYLNTALFEEVASNPEMQLYIQWLAKVAPGAKPDYFGLYAWSAGRLFVKTATSAGAKLTRAGLVTELKKIHDWTANGLHAAQDVGNKMPTPCFLYVKVDGQRFVRDYPASGWSCDKGGLYKLSKIY